MTTRQDLRIQAGADWSFTYTHSEDITGYSARMSVKQHFGDSEEIYFSTGADADGGTIEIDGTGVTLSMTALQTQDVLSNITYGASLYQPEKRKVETFMYDLEIVSGAGVVTRILQGKFLVEREVTD